MFCRTCGKEMTGKDSKLYCSNACKQKNERAKPKLESAYDDLKTAIVPYQQQTAIVPQSTMFRSDRLATGVMRGLEGNIVGSVTEQLRNVTDINANPFYTWGSLVVAGLGFMVGGNIDDNKNKFNWKNSVIGSAIGFFAFQVGANLVLQYKNYKYALQFKQAELAQLQQAELAQLQQNNSLNDKIISSEEVKYIIVPFIKMDGVYSDFIGEKINENSVIMVYGDPGSGKSHFVTQFSAYLEGKGKVLYVLAEEGITDSVKERLARYNVTKSDIVVTRDVNLILDKASSYHYVIIDSLNGLTNYNNHTDIVKKLKNKNLHALVLVNQVNKEGAFVGRNDLLHEADVEIYVENGVAVTKKNRFNTQPTKMSIFSNDKIN